VGGDHAKDGGCNIEPTGKDAHERRRAALVLDIETKADAPFLAREDVLADLRDSVRVPGNYSKAETIAAPTCKDSKGRRLGSACVETKAKAAFKTASGER